MKSSLRKLINISNLLFNLYWRHCTPIIIYQMGKVGSASVYQSLREMGLKGVYHTHRMDPENFRSHINSPKKNLNKLIDEQLGSILYSQVINMENSAKIITMVREPISRNISAFFQNFEVFVGTDFRDWKGSLEELRRLFLFKYPHQVPLTWFDIELKRALNIDVYEIPFPHDSGWQSINSGPFELLILRTELDDTAKAAAIASFLNHDNIFLTRSNTALEKPYAKTYDEFKKQLRLPRDYLNLVLDSKYGCHFYSDLERSFIREGWRSQIVDEPLPVEVKHSLLLSLINS